MPTLRERLTAASNDYSELERQYEDAVGAPLLLDGLQIAAAVRRPLTRSASVLIGTFNSAPSLDRTLLSLEACSFNRVYPDRFQVIVVDDGSTDGTRELVCDRVWAMNLIYVRQAHAGLTVAHNTGIAFTSHDIVVFSDSDLVHTPFAIEELMRRHEVLEGVTLVGFRFEVEADDPRAGADAIRCGLPELGAAFHRDFRLNFPGWPANMCQATDHLKTFGHRRTMRMANGAAYDLPALVVGAFFSLQRDDFLRMGASDERLIGWGCEDSLIGARSIALGNAVVPVYSAASGHMSHPKRTPHEAEEFVGNIATVTRILDEPFEVGLPVPLERYRGRALEVVERRASVPAGDLAATCRAVRPRDDASVAEDARIWFALGEYEHAVPVYDEAVRLAPADIWHRLGLARSLREIGQISASLEGFDAAERIDAQNPWVRYERGLTHARAVQYEAAREAIATARALSPDVFEFGWVLDTPTEAHKARGNHHAAQGYHAVAVRDFDLALIVDACNCWAHYDRGLSLNMLGRHEDALVSLRATDKLLHPQDGNRTWLHNQLGYTCMQVGLTSEAKVQLEKALALLPSNVSAANHLAYLNDRGEREHGLHRHLAAVEAARGIEGWLSDVEADLLVAASVYAASRLPAGERAAVVEIGTYCGKSTVVIGSTFEMLGAPVTVHAVDPHLDYHFGRFADTYAIAADNIAQRGLNGRVQIIRARSTDLEWSTPIVLLFVDGLHDYEHVLADFRHFAPHVVPGGLIAFHDYFEHCPGVKQCINELLLEGACEFVTHRDRLILCRKPTRSQKGCGS
jgi:tetratricopeptide (TPR) repeat protein/GT2 family glycosyltransferase